MGKGRNRLVVTLEATALTKHFVSLSLNIRIEAVFVLCIVNRIVTNARAWFFKCATFEARSRNGICCRSFLSHSNMGSTPYLKQTATRRTAVQPCFHTSLQLR